MADIEDALNDIERRLLDEGAGQWLAQIEQLKRLVAMGDPSVGSFIQSMTLSSIDLAAVTRAVGQAYAASAADSALIVGATATPEQHAAISDLGSHRVPADVGAQSGVLSEATKALFKARLLLAAGIDPMAAAAGLVGNGNVTRGILGSLITTAAANATHDVGTITRKPLVWVAERNACVRCLAHSGHVVSAGGTFPPGLTYGPYSYDDGVKTPPLHPHCRCHLEVLNDPAYAAALRREADRSVLRGYSLETESMSVRLKAARKLIDNGVDAPKSVIAYGERAIKNGKFPTRVVPKVKPEGPPSQPRTPPPPTSPRTPKPPRTPGGGTSGSATAARTAAMREEAARLKAERLELERKRKTAERELAKRKAADPVTDPKTPLSKTLAKATTPREMATMAAARHPSVDWSKWTTARGLDADHSRIAIGQVSDLLDEFPGAKLTEVKPYAIRNNGVFAQVRTPIGRDANGKRVNGTPGMEISSGFLRNPERHRTLTEQASATGHFHGVTGDTAMLHTVTHEFGHVLDSNSQNALSRLFVTMKNDALAANGATFKNGRMVGYPKEAYEWSKANISGYGNSSTAEGVAEMFAEGRLKGADASPFAQAFYKAALELLKKEGMTK